MMISGHKTRSMFERYNIVSEDDLREAMERTTSYLREIALQSHRAGIIEMRSPQNSENPDSLRTVGMK